MTDASWVWKVGASKGCDFCKGEEEWDLDFFQNFVGTELGIREKETDCDDVALQFGRRVQMNVKAKIAPKIY